MYRRLPIYSVAATKTICPYRACQGQHDRRRHAARHPALRWPEAALNDWGYRLLSTGRARDALPLFQFIARHFPHSANAHDSLAQASLVNGDAAAALLHYERALALDPANDSARRHVDELRGGGSMAGVPPR